MTNINCSETCIFEKNGKCELNHISTFSNISDIRAKCAYFTPRENTKKASPKF